VKISALIVIALIVSSCGKLPTVDRFRKVPLDQKNACNIFSERPDIKKALNKAYVKYGVPSNVTLAIMKQESSFVSNARPPKKYVLGVIPAGRQSSAYGYSQALDGTWSDYLAASGLRKSRRDNIYHSADFMGWYMMRSAKQGIPVTNAKHQYLAYHEGHAGYKRGSWRQKKWLVDVSNRVSSDSKKFKQQIRFCR
jgi:hypothetical protein